MGTILQTNIFFLITSVFVIILTFFLIVIGYYSVKILKNFFETSEVLKNSVKNVDNEVRGLAENIKANPIFRFIFKSKNKKPHDEKTTTREI